MERAFKIGCTVYFFDSHRVAHAALVTNWFHGGPDGQTEAELQKVHEERQEKVSPEHRSPTFSRPCCNVVFVSEDEEKKDPYGRQLERQTSCQYGGQMYVPFTGMCWCWPDELEEAKKLAAEAYAKAVAK